MKPAITFLLAFTCLLVILKLEGRVAMWAVGAACVIIDILSNWPSP